MTNPELILNMLAEASAKDISEATDPETFEEHMETARKGSSVARAARLELERSTGRKIVTGLTAKGIRRLKARKEEEFPDSRPSLPQNSATRFFVFGAPCPPRGRRPFLRMAQKSSTTRSLKIQAASASGHSGETVTTLRRLGGGPAIDMETSRACCQFRSARSGAGTGGPAHKAAAIAENQLPARFGVAFTLFGLSPPPVAHSARATRPPLPWESGYPLCPATRAAAPPLGLLLEFA